MAKKITSESTEEIKKLLTSDNLIIGTKRTIKLLKQGKISKVFMTSNCPAGVAQDIEHYAGIGSVEIVRMTQANDELGALCKKPYSISLLGVPK